MSFAIAMECCDRWFVDWHAYHQHMKNSSRHNYCGSCNEDFDSYEDLRQHWIQSPSHSFCRQCDTHFDDDDDLLEHCLDEHHYCQRCDRFFRNANGLHEHRRQSPSHANVYCVECRILFNSESNLRAVSASVVYCPNGSLILVQHLNSSVHRPKNVPCAFQHYGCTQWFVSKAAMISHLEAGACVSGANRDMVNRWVKQQDRHGVITDPSRLITNGDDTRWIATERSWNGYAYECVLCHSTFRTLDALNRHLASPRHQERMYRCPLSTCLMRFNTLSGLCQHVESERCGILRFRSAREGMDRLLGDMGRLRIQGESRRCPSSGLH